MSTTLTQSERLLKRVVVETRKQSRDPQPFDREVTRPLIKSAIYRAGGKLARFTGEYNNNLAVFSAHGTEIATNEYEKVTSAEVRYYMTGKLPEEGICEGQRRRAFLICHFLTYHKHPIKRIVLTQRYSPLRGAQPFSFFVNGYQTLDCAEGIARCYGHAVTQAIKRFGSCHSVAIDFE